jgi:TonB family protein
VVGARNAQILLISLCVSVSVAAWAQQPATESPAEFFEKAAALSDLRAPGSPALALRASFGFASDNGKRVSGRYSLLWLSPDRWREDIQVPSLSYWRTRLGGKDRYWQVRSIPYELPQIGELMRGVNFVARLREAVREPLGKVREKNRNGEKETCVALHSRADMFCFAPDGTLAEIRRVSPSLGKLATWEYSDHISFGGKVIPRAIRRLGSKKNAMSFAVDAIEPLRDVNPSVFVPPPQAQAWEACANPIPAKMLKLQQPNYPIIDRVKRISGDVELYGVVDTQGALEDLRVISAPDVLLARAALEAVQQWRYQPTMCDGRAIRVETNITVHFRLGR